MLCKLGYRCPQCHPDLCLHEAWWLFCNLLQVLCYFQFYTMKYSEIQQTNLYLRKYRVNYDIKNNFIGKIGGHVPPMPSPPTHTTDPCLHEARLLFCNLLQDMCYFQLYTMKYSKIQQKNLYLRKFRVNYDIKTTTL